MNIIHFVLGFLAAVDRYQRDHDMRNSNHDYEHFIEWLVISMKNGPLLACYSNQGKQLLSCWRGNSFSRKEMTMFCKENIENGIFHTDISKFSALSALLINRIEINPSMLINKM